MHWSCGKLFFIIRREAKILISLSHHGFSPPLWLSASLCELIIRVRWPASESAKWLIKRKKKFVSWWPARLSAGDDDDQS